MGNDANAVLVAVMGPTGSGKTSFINLASESNMIVGNNLQSCTNQIQLSPSFKLNGRNVTLIDTPGFDDTMKSDTDILNNIASYLASTYQAGRRLSGILYFHRITDFKMSGISARNFRMFRELCGDTTLKNVVIVTNMWAGVDPVLGEEREAELAGKDCFFKPVLSKGARMMRHGNTTESVRNILRSVMENEPEALRIQKEIVEEGKDVSQTAAAAEVDRELKKQEQQHREEMARIQREMQDAVRVQEEKARREREAEEARKQAEIAEQGRQAEERERQMREERARLEQRMREEREAAERRAAEEAAERQRQAAEFEALVRRAHEEAERAKAHLMEEMRRVQAEANRRRHNGCVIA